MVKIFKSDHHSVAFSTESLYLYPLPERVADALPMDEAIDSERAPEPLADDCIDNSPPGITGLVLLTAQTCNLKCSYCFAEAYMGSRPDEQVMNPATASAAIEKVFSAAPGTPWVQFLGGEPLLGFAAIREAAKSGERYCVDHRAQRPAFAITTNGTLVDQRAIDFFKAHDFSVTVSLDGPRHVNDRQRRFPSGSGTYDIVKKNIDRLRKAGLGVRIEAVFTDRHTDEKETIESTYRFLSRFSAGDICLKPAIGGSPGLDRDSLAHLEKTYAASTERIMDSWLTDSPMRLTYWVDILETIISRKGKTHFCGAGFNTITVDCSGKVFPCHTLMSDRFYMGNVHDADFPGRNFRKVAALMRRSSKESFSKCVRCWARKLCSPCYGDTSFASGTLGAPRESLCVIIRAAAETTLLKIAEFMIDGDKWKRFVENVNRTTIRSGSDCRDRAL
jgi:uncharacterized protein